jgi:hypothetical protein
MSRFGLRSLRDPLLLALFGIALQAALPAFAQTCSSTPPVNKPGWPKNQAVKAYIDPAIQGDARTAVVQAFQNWNTANQSNGSGVTYTISATQPTSGATFTVSYVNSIIANGTPTRASTAITQSTSTNITLSAATTIDVHVTSYAAVLETMAHEIGHPAGFADCPNCAPADSVMGPAQFDANNPSTFNQTDGRATAPTACDNQTLKTNDYPPPPPSGGGGGGGGGTGGSCIEGELVTPEECVGTCGGFVDGDFCDV